MSEELINLQKSGGKTTHTETYTPAANTAANDMGIQHNYRYVNTSGLVPQKESQTKSITATTAVQTVTPDSGKELISVTVNPQSHSSSYTPAVNTSSNDMGANHNYRYVNTSGMYKPSGTYNAGSYTTNGSKTISGLTAYTAATFSINVPTSATLDLSLTGSASTASGDSSWSTFSMSKLKLVAACRCWKSAGGANFSVFGDTYLPQLYDNSYISSSNTKVSDRSYRLINKTFNAFVTIDLANPINEYANSTVRLYDCTGTNYDPHSSGSEILALISNRSSTDSASARYKNTKGHLAFTYQFIQGHYLVGRQYVDGSGIDAVINIYEITS